MDNKVFSYNQNIIDVYSNLIKVGGVFLKHKFLLISLIVVGNAIAYTTYHFKSDVYVSSSQVIVEAKGNGLSNSLMSMAAQFGVNSGAGADEEKVAKLFLTRTIIFPALVEKCEIDGEEDFLANHYIKRILLPLGRKIKPLEETDKFDFEKNLTLRQVYNHIVGIKNGIIFSDLDKEGFVTVNISTNTEEISFYLNKHILNSIEGFYVNKSKVNEKYSINILKEKLDSISKEMEMVENGYAIWKEKNIESMNASSMVDDLRFQRKLELLNKMYLETYKSIEFKRINVQFNENYIRVVNFPTLPIFPNNKSLILYHVIGSVLSIAIGICSVLIYQVFRDLKEIVHE